jgi:hypothetical protein
MRKSDQVLMWEAFTGGQDSGSISTGGPLGDGGSTPSKSQSSTTEQGEEEAEGLMGLVAKLLQGVEDGSIDEGEACEHLQMVLSGEVEESEHESKEEQEKEDEGDYSAHEEDNEAEDDKPAPKAVRRPWAKPYSGPTNTKAQRDAQSGAFKRNKGIQQPVLRQPRPDQKGI